MPQCLDLQIESVTLYLLHLQNANSVSALLDSFNNIRPFFSYDRPIHQRSHLLWARKAKVPFLYNIKLLSFIFNFKKIKKNKGELTQYYITSMCSIDRSAVKNSRSSLWVETIGKYFVKEVFWAELRHIIMFFDPTRTDC